ncbi:MAG: hypothetical protein O2901_12620 [Verrucomicrobia bacterium]|nr:hypothetical protein [Verrucomicrobiota bacterium]
MKLLAAICCCLAVVGCGSKSSDSSKTTSEEVLDGVTGRTAVDAGLRAKQQIEDVSQKKNEDLSEVLGE